MSTVDVYPHQSTQIVEIAVQNLAWFYPSVLVDDCELLETTQLAQNRGSEDGIFADVTRLLGKAYRQRSDVLELRHLHLTHKGGNPVVLYDEFRDQPPEMWGDVTVQVRG